MTALGLKSYGGIPATLGAGGGQDEYGDTLEEAEELLEDFHKCAEEIEELIDMHSKVLYSRMTLQEYGKNIDRMGARSGGELALDKVF